MLHGVVHLLLLLVLALPASSGLQAPPAATRAHVWTGSWTDPGFTPPELSSGPFGVPALQTRPNIGFAATVGALVGAVADYGWLRGLHELGLLDSMRYLSASSGGCWVVAPYAYGDTPAAQFFSPYMPPAQLTPQALTASLMRGSWGAAVSQPSVNMLRGYVPDPFKSRAKPTAWAEAMASMFLRPFKLDATDSTVSMAGTNGDVAQRVTQQASSLGLSTMLAGKSGQPYPILTGTVVAAPKAPGFAAYASAFVPRAQWEFTPLYSGMGADFPGFQPAPLGRGLVEPLAANAVLSDGPPPQAVVSPEGSQTVGVRPAAAPASLKTAMGICSGGPSLVALVLNTSLPRLTSLQQLTPVNPAAGFQTTALSVTDSGLLDPTGVLPLLRRGVAHVVITHLAMTDIAANTAASFAGVRLHTFGMFGVASDPTFGPAAALNAMVQVFPTEDWAPLYAQFQAKRAAGLPVVVTSRHQVLPNAYQGIKGGYTVNVLWLVNNPVPTWEAQLPAATRAILDRGRTSPLPLAPLKDFPLTAIVASLPPRATSLYSQLATYAVVSNAALIRQWFADAAAAAAVGR